MAAEARAREKSLKGWFNKRGRFNYRHINRAATLTVMSGWNVERTNRPAALLRKIEQRFRFFPLHPDPAEQRQTE